MALHIQIIDFLKNKGWSTIEQKTNFEILEAPLDLNFNKPFTMRVYTNESMLDYTNTAWSTIQTISELYKKSPKNLFTIFNEGGGEILSIRSKSSDTLKGSISFKYFEDWLKNFKELLFDTAQFTLDPKPYFENKIPEAENYINSCRFLQTEKGSFITKILLPAKQVIRHRTLFDNVITGSDVNKKLYNTINFINKWVIKSDGEFDNTFFTQNKDNINLHISKSLNSILNLEPFKNSEFFFFDNLNNHKIVFRDLDTPKLQKLELFIKTIDSSIKEEEIQLEIKGSIISLSVKDGLNYEKNTIKILGMHERLGPLVVKIKLEESDYYKAIDAHKNKGIVQFKGKVVRLKNTNNEYKSLTHTGITFFETGTLIE